MHHTPDARFPNGIPNPLLLENHAKTADVVREQGADFGVAFDGDFDRCFLFDEEGALCLGEYVIGLLAAAYLAKSRVQKLCMTRVIWNTIETVEAAGGILSCPKQGMLY